MLQERLNEPFKMVSWRELAQIEHKGLTDDTIARYVETRDMSVLPPLEDFHHPPCVFHCIPLQEEFEHLLKTVIEGNQTAVWQLFATHVTNADNFNSSDGSPILKWIVNKNNRRIIDDSCRKKVILQTRNEVTNVITEKAAVGDYGPFELPVMFSRDMIRFQARRAMLAARDGANKKTETDTKKAQIPRGN